MHRKIKIGDRLIGEGERCYIIAEAGSNHDQKINQAKELIDIAAKSGVDAVKFQLFRADKLYKPGDAAYKIVQDNELPRKWLRELIDHAHDHGLEFMASPFDQEAVDLMDDLGVTSYKIASSEIFNHPLLKHVASKNKPILLSTGMCNLADIYEAYEIVRQSGSEHLVLLHCAALYPTGPQQVNLRFMETLKNTFQVPVGFSDHTLGILMPPIAVSKGACLIEKHFTKSRTLPGPDHGYAIEPDELAQMVRNIRIAEESFGSPLKAMLPEEKKLARRESIFAKCNISKDTIIDANMVEMRRPALGIEPRYIKAIIGRPVKRSVKKDEPITWEVI